MTMPKLEPVGWLGTATHPDDIDGEESVVYCFSQEMATTYRDESGYEIEPHFSEDQLTEAYEAGKRDATPEGYALVPKQPTLLMLRAMYPCESTTEAYKAMLAAAPKGEE